ncbi:hypothetical protein [Ekhidna sp.]|uniref:hypothetical protein n=1 Tax=Ekhidna sp. TaxID=2608089 RepID=UPI0032EE99D6
MAKSTINKQQLFLEFLSVVTGVLIALMLNSWRENVATSRTLDRVKQTIRTEMNNNTNEVSDALTYHKALIKELYEGRHLIMAIPASAFPVNVNDDTAFEQFLRETVPFMQSTAVTRLELLRNGNERILILNDQNLRLVVENDTIKLFGVSNLQLRTADVSNRSWEIAQATGMLVEMDLELVDVLNKCYNLNNQYLETSNKAIEMIYKGEPGIISVMEDMAYYEQEIIKADSLVLNLIK